MSEALIKIKIPTGGRNSGRVPVSVNGDRRFIIVGKEVEVSPAIHEALLNSDIVFEVVGGDAGVSSSLAAPEFPLGAEAPAPTDADGDAQAGMRADDHELTPADGDHTPKPPAPEAESGTTAIESINGGDPTANEGPSAQQGNDPDVDLLSGNLVAVRDGVAALNDRVRLSRLLDLEKGAGPDKARKGAITAIEDRIAELDKSEA